MKIFNKTEEWSGKVNFVDDDNVLVGYSLTQACCEHADWFISTTEDNDVKEDNGIVDVDGYFFDKNYFVEVEPKKEGSEDYRYSVLDEGGMVRFKLVAFGKPDLFLHLYNSHNGYYGHGFEATIGGIKWQDGCL
jgi:hypothetical protein